MTGRDPVAFRPDRTDRCSSRSEAAQEPLAGTASTIRRWLLVEHGGPWGRDGLLDARLPEGLGAALRSLERRTRCRVLLIRRPSRSDGVGAACFAVDTAEAWIGATTLGRIEDAAEMHPSDRAGFPNDVEHPVAVVCTHGRRDVCCAERGRPLAAAAAVRFPGTVWESTHVGGDRFAGNMVLFPHGLVFGRVDPDRGADVLSAYGQGRISLDRYRGRTSHPMPAQAADRAVRERFSLDRIDDVRVLGVDRDGALARVRLGLVDGEVVVVHLLRTGLPAMRLTCSSRTEESAATWIVESIGRA
ncbi:MAG: sucrase ferredoxin [Actinomycetota bacterium]